MVPLLSMCAYAALLQGPGLPDLPLCPADELPYCHSTAFDAQAAGETSALHCSSRVARGLGACTMADMDDSHQQQNWKPAMESGNAV
jgi:hypothetical protein